MAGLFSRLSQRVLAPQGNVQPAAINRAGDLAPAEGSWEDAGMAESFAAQSIASAREPAQSALQSGSLAERVTGFPETTAGIPARIVNEKVEATEFAATHAPPWPTVSAWPAVKPVELGPEAEDFIPRRQSAPPGAPADAAREMVRAVQDIVPRRAASFPARRASLDSLPVRATQSDSAAPVIHVTIDRIDVHQPPAPAPAPRAPPARSATISLGDYLSGSRRNP